MKILIIHISDMHIGQNDFFYKQKITSLATTLNSYTDVQKIYLMCSGDLASCGSQEDYYKVKLFFSMLITEIKKVKKQFIELYIVPGNHDIQVQKGEITEINSDNLKTEYDKMKPFFSFSSKLHGLNYKILKPYDVVSIVNKLDDKKNISINLINTAPFSNLNHTDKERHYIEHESLNKINCNEYFNITLMHHSFNWFHESVKFELEKQINKTDLLLCGHEHEPQIKENSFVSNDIVISKAGAFDVDYYNNNCFFNIISLDFDINKLKIVKYAWDKSCSMFLEEENYEKDLIKSKYKYSEDFTDELFNDKKVNIGLHLKDYFTFPYLRKVEEDGTSEKILSMDRLCDYSANSIVSIVGKRETGKTTILKFIYNEIRKKYLTIFIRSEELDNQNINKVIKHSIQDQLISSHSFDIFNQLSKDDKAIIIDDFDKIRNKKIKEALIEYLESGFGTIIVSAEKKEVDDLKEEFKEKYSLEIKEITISSFTSKERNEIVNKISFNKNVDINDSIIADIEKTFKTTPFLRVFGDSFILNYLNMFLLSGNLMASEGKNNFNVLFEQTIRSSIIKFTDQEDVELYLKVLEELSYFAHFNKMEKITIESISHVVKEYNQSFRKNVSITYFVESMVKARILEEVDTNIYMYVNKMYLSYFVAQNICFKIVNQEDISKFNEVLDKVCFGINGDILLFVIYISKNMKLINLILRKIQWLTKEWDVLSLDDKNIFIFRQEIEPLKIKKVDKNTIKKYKEQEIDQEVIDFNTYNITCESIYDYDETEVNNFFNQLNCLIKYIDLLCRGLQSFNASLLADLQIDIVEGIYESTNKYLFRIISQFNDENVDEFVNDICKTSPKLEPEKVKSNLVKFILIFIKATYERVVSLISGRNTNQIILEYFRDYTNNDSNVRIFTLLLHEQINNNKKFFENLDLCLREKNNYCVLFIIRLIILNSILTRDMSEKDRNHYLDLYNNRVVYGFKIDKSKLALEKYKNH